MKTFFLLCLAGILFIIPMQASTTLAEKQARDSIFREAASIAVDSLRSAYLRNAFQQYIGQDFAAEFLDSALALSKRKQLHNEELWGLYDYCRQHEYQKDIKAFEKGLAKLKDASYRYKEYSFYFTMQVSYLQVRCAQGDTEYAIIQAQEMNNEAIRLKYKVGTFIATIALGQAYEFAGRNDDATNTYLKALAQYPTANNDAKMMIHARLARIYQTQKKYPQALKELQTQIDILTEMSQGSKLSGTFKSVFLDVEISFCKIYLEIRDLEKLNKHLQNAQKYYYKDIYVGSLIDYHALWGSYYKFTKEWNKCFEEFKTALSACDGTDPFHENEVLKMYASALLEAGNQQEAANIYKTAALRADSLNQDMLLRHKEAHQANYNIQKALLEKEKLIQRHLYIQVGAAAIILLLLIFLIIRASYIRRQLQRAEEGTRQAYETIKAADAMKDRFMHNITYEIRIPLNTVVGFSELLSSENDLTDEELEEYSTAVKSNSVKLLSLINNILDLSRLEAGMMRFMVQECDIVQLCREAKMMVEMQTPHAVNLTFNTELESLQAEVDSKWFLKLLTSLFSVPTNYTGEVYNVEYVLSKEDKLLNITITGSPLYQCWEDEQEQHILHNINRLYVETFKGRYRVLGEEGKKKVYITYPIS